jgi:hypothetical protein
VSFPVVGEESGNKTFFPPRFQVKSKEKNLFFTDENGKKMY